MVYWYCCWFFVIADCCILVYLLVGCWFGCWLRFAFLGIGWATLLVCGVAYWLRFVSLVVLLLFIASCCYFPCLWCLCSEFGEWI